MKPKYWIRIPSKIDKRFSWDFRHFLTFRKIEYWHDVAVMYIVGPIEIYICEENEKVTSLV